MSGLGEGIISTTRNDFNIFLVRRLHAGVREDGGPAGVLVLGVPDVPGLVAD